MNIKNKLIVIAFAGLLFSFSSCKKYLDVNKNPNVAQTATSSVLLPTGEMYIASTMAVDMQIDGSIWAQYWTQSPNASQYRDLEQYAPNSSTFQTPWTNLYTGAGANLEQLYTTAAAKNQRQYMAISLLLRAYMFQVITDAWGDVPFHEALRGLPQYGGITSPHYDPQQSIYQGLLTYIDSAYKMIDPNDPGHPNSDDLIYGGNMTQWQKFANTLKLRILLRMSEKNPSEAQSGIAQLYSASPVFLGPGDDAQIQFTSTSGNKNPLFSEETGLFSTQNFVASNTCIDSMVSDSDARVTVFYEPDANGNYTGIPQGAYSSTVPTVSIPSYNVAGDASSPVSATAPTKLLTGYESLFLQAEAVARGWATGNDDSLFNAGIAASFADWNVSAALPTYLASGYWAQYPATGTTAQKIRFIITQKWFSMCGNEGFEAWTEWRRTGYPDFFVPSINRLNNSPFPRRFIYPYSEVTQNANFPGLKPITAPVWWDIH